MKLALLLPLTLLACLKDETISGYTDRTTTWHLEEVDGTPVTYRATLSFPEEGTVRGRAPCNQFTGTQSLPLPWFSVTDIAATRMACPDLAAETAFFEALEAMTLAEPSDTILILTNDTDREMVFRAGTEGTDG